LSGKFRLGSNTKEESANSEKFFSVEAGKMVVKKETLTHSLEVLWETLLSVQAYRWMDL
jgi:hypothetical protein